MPGFWEVIAQARRAVGGWEGAAEAVTSILSDWTDNAILEFAEAFEQSLAESYRWDLWGAAYVINGGCSDDGFEYFRAWLIAQGQGIFEAALKDPDGLAAVLEQNLDVFEYEEMLGCARDAWDRRHPGTRMPLTTRRPVEPAGTPWSEDEVFDLFPRLAARFG